MSDDKIQTLLDEMSRIAHSESRTRIFGPLDRLRLWCHDPEMFAPLSPKDGAAILSMIERPANPPSRRSDYDLQTVRAMADAGLAAEVRFGGGFCTETVVSLSPDQVIGYLSQGLDYVLRLQGIEPDEFEQWQQTDGLALCAQTLRNGSLCGNQVASQCSLTDWKRIHRNEYCHRHGG